MRALPVLAGLLLAAAPITLAAAPPRDWTTVAAPVPDGVLIGNPAARVKLVEYASYTCPHCAAFAQQSAAPLDQMIRSGTTSFEIRHVIRDRMDLAAVLLAHCAGPGRVEAIGRAIWADQPRWLVRALEYQQTNAGRLALYPALDQVKAYAQGAGLTDVAAANGVAPAAIDRCLSDQAAIDRVVAAAARMPASITATPTFFVNGKQLAVAEWPKLEPVLRAAGAR